MLTRQVRCPALVIGHQNWMLIEEWAGLLDRDEPEACIRTEAEEKAGYRLEAVECVFATHLSPSSVTEAFHFFVAVCDSRARIGVGGGVETNGEKLATVARGEIVDAKTILAPRYAALNRLGG